MTITIITITLLALITSTANAAVKVGSYVGTWKASTAYAAGDLITYSNKTFLSLAKNKAKNPNSNLKVWQVLGGVGAQGIPGVQGIAGPRGAPGIPTGGTDGVGVIGLQGIPGVQGIAGPRGAPGIPTGGTDVGDMQYWDGTQWQVVPIIQADPTIKPTLALCEGVPTWVLYHCPGTSPYSIGETGPAGGKVFYVTDGGLHGLEAAPIDQATSVWGCFGPSNTGAHNPNVGTGAENTAAIVAGCSEANTAAKVADAYVFNGFTDWFLPSSGELGLLYVQAHVVGGFTLGNYWSSTEYYAPNGGGWDSGGAWFQNFFYDVQFKYTNKFNAYRVRSIRTF